MFADGGLYKYTIFHVSQTYTHNSFFEDFHITHKEIELHAEGIGRDKALSGGGDESGEG